jgi:hypothetical protein
VDLLLQNLKPFMLEIMMRCQVEKVINDGHNNFLTLDLMFYTNKYKVFLSLLITYLLGQRYSDVVRIHEILVYSSLIYQDDDIAL